MPASILEIKDRLTRVIDENGSVRDMASASEAISILEKMTVTKEELESTRLGLYVNNIRRASKNSPLAKRAKNLIISWKKLINKRTLATPIIQQTRPETPNSVGSSPSPPEPSDFSIIRNYSSPQLTSVTTPRSGTPTSDPGVRKSKKYRTSPDSGGRKKDVPDGGATLKGQSSDVKSGKQPLDTEQHTMSVGSNGLKLTFKTRPLVQELTNQESELSGSQPPSLQRSQTDLNLQTFLHKHHKKKKGHKSPPKVSSPALPTSTKRITTTQQEDAFNNNNTEHKIKSSKSTPNFTVKKTTPEKVLPKIATPKSYNNLKSISPDNSTLSLKRKRENTMVDVTSPEISSESKPRAPKERRLTYDPATGQLKQVPSLEKLDKPISVQPQTAKKPPEKTTTTTKNTSSSIKNMKGSSQNLKTQSSSVTRLVKTTTGPQKRLSLGKTAVNLTPRTGKGVTNPKIASEVNENEVSDFRSKELPARLSPTVAITGTSSVTPKKWCSENCSSSNLYKSRREFRKRKTRRKNTTLIDLKTIFPISSAVETLSSDSDESSTNLEDNFCKSINISESADDTHQTHSRNCVWPGVTGCRGNNGSWFDWTEIFCVKNQEKSEALPGEEEIMPLHILPYVELD